MPLLQAPWVDCLSVLGCYDPFGILMLYNSHAESNSYPIKKSLKLTIAKETHLGILAELWDSSP